MMLVKATRKVSTCTHMREDLQAEACVELCEIWHDYDIQHLEHIERQGHSFAEDLRR